ncbi:hypothetical protein [Nesterenkonia muleiensis]|uniref:hypothetical protein n=1 Tax=Nesterenkonia muleiensis TaxID=2282648 RepID=UPI000E753716|nr:hypothetical protein [Nesterenkonia muleiensis]
MSPADKDPGRLERAAQELNAVAGQLERLAAHVKSYENKVVPISGELNALVGGSTTGRDKRIAQQVGATAKSIRKGSDAAHQAVGQAKHAAIRAKAEAEELRRREAADRQAQHRAARR